jgi:hypothetical protein
MGKKITLDQLDNIFHCEFLVREVKRWETLTGSGGGNMYNYVDFTVILVILQFLKIIIKLVGIYQLNAF